MKKSPPCCVRPRIAPRGVAAPQRSYGYASSPRLATGARMTHSRRPGIYAQPLSTRRLLELRSPTSAEEPNEVRRLEAVS